MYIWHDSTYTAIGVLYIHVVYTTPVQIDTPMSHAQVNLIVHLVIATGSNVQETAADMTYSCPSQ